MTTEVRQRLFGWEQAFDHPFTFWATLGLALAAVSVTLLVLALHAAGRLGDKTYLELRARCLTWVVLVPLLLGPVLAGAFWTMLAVALLGALCYFELARHTPLANEYAIHSVALAGFAAVTFGALDRWWEFFSGAFPLTVVAMAAITIFGDRPQGYLQRVALGTLAFGLFGMGLGHLGYMANDDGYRPVLILLLLAVEANDIFAYLCGKALGRRKLIPHTSPNKTVGGSAGALVLTSVLVMVLGRWVFMGTPVARPQHLLIMGLTISALGQLGDLVVSSIKRDLGIKDMGSSLPGHGGLLDRFDSLLLVAPAIHYYLGYFHGLGADQPIRIFTSRWL